MKAFGLPERQAGALVAQGLEHHRAGRLDEAEALYRQALQMDSRHADGLHLYGCLSSERGDYVLAADLIARAVEQNRNVAAYHFNLGNVLSRQGLLEQAVRYYRTAIRLKADYAAAFNNLALAEAKKGDKAEAKRLLLRAVRLDPAYAEAHYNLGLALKDEGDTAGALAEYAEAVRHKPDYTDAYYNQANTLSEQGHLEAAVLAYRKVLALDPAHAKASTNLGSVLMKQGKLQAAEVLFSRAKSGGVTDVLASSNLILTAGYGLDDPGEVYRRCVNWSRAHAAPSTGAEEPYLNDCESSRRLRIGYVSADFRHHAASYWIEPVLAAHDRETFEVVCYHSADREDDTTARMKSHGDTWVDCIHMSDRELATRIRNDRIDILVDLSGHTDGNRLLTFALAPAPVQVSWFGFPCTTGLETMRYRFTDEFMNPPAEGAENHSEELVRLSRFYAAYRPEPESLHERREGMPTFLSVNNLAKITPKMLEVWAEILHGVPGSRLLFQSAGLDEPVLAAEIRAFFGQRGISGDRIELRGWAGIRDYFALGGEADVALDPYPFNGGVSTCHTLWMGAPVVTLRGRTVASRVGASILTRCGLADLVGESEAGYRAIAIRLMKDRERLSQLRASLRDRMAEGGLLDGKGLIAEVETAYREMWRAWCRNA